jgi:RHS repeat-associated protein
VQSSKSGDHPSSAYLHRLRGENRSLFIGHNTDAYGNTLIYTGPGPDGIWFTEDDFQSDYGANETIFQGREYDPESQLYYFRTRYYVPTLGRFVNRNPWGYIQGRYNLYNVAKDNPVASAEPFSAVVVFGIAIGVDELLVALGITAGAAGAVGVGIAAGTGVNKLRQSCPPPDPKCAALAAQLAALTATAGDDQRKINELNDRIWFKGGSQPLLAPLIGMYQNDYLYTVQEMREVAAELAEC